jgi:hypothetical protein|tara:strand:- start:407 stop:598 length:192 start_codon:yes stop_codon:yes gene_type:complete
LLRSISTISSAFSFFKVETTNLSSSLLCFLIAIAEGERFFLTAGFFAPIILDSSNSFSLKYSV